MSTNGHGEAWRISGQPYQPRPASTNGSDPLRRPAYKPLRAARDIGDIGEQIGEWFLVVTVGGGFTALILHGVWELVTWPLL